MAKTRETRVLTVAAVRKAKGAKPAEYLFNETPQIFTLRPTTKAARESSRLLSQAFQKKLPARVLVDTRRALIQRIEIPSREEVLELRRKTVRLEKPNKTMRVDVKAIDPTKFNIVDYYLKRPVFRLCTRVVPSYTKAKEIFEFCAKQSCHLPGPYDIAPCIPFQYVRDGCYARAHKMRWIITTKYRYCCEKVFSFANQNDDVLAVKADKWGGCCVTWWYHVAPLIRMKVKLGKWSLTLAMVIDPGMFNKPVLLSTWLSAQKNTTCSSRANVSMYSIQAGSAYSPANYAGTAFSTDPTYTSTDATLTAYCNLKTCP